MAEVTDIRIASRGSRRRRVYLDGCEWRSVPQEVVRDIGLRVGQSTDTDYLAARIASSSPQQAWERALRLLNFRERGSGELLRRLLDDGYDEDAATAAVERARELGFLDDRRFAEGLARGLADGKRQGRRRIAAGLAAKGVDEALAAEVLASCCDEDAEADRAAALARKLMSGRALDAPRLASRLVSKGFEPALAWRVARAMADTADNASDEA